jgi:hypothetical protein
MWIRSGNRVAAPIVAAALLVAGCKKDKPATTTPVDPAGSTLAATSTMDPTLCADQGKNVQTFDLNADNKTDVWRLYRTEDQGGVRVDVLTCKQVDFDHDGKMDWVVGYTPKGVVSYEKADFDYDGRFDMAAVYDLKTGLLTEIERDSDFDGQYDTKESYDSAGKLAAVERTRDGKKIWEQYRDEELVALLYDDNGDNVVDRREEAPGAQGGAPASGTPAPDGAAPDAAPAEGK